MGEIIAALFLTFAISYADIYYYEEPQPFISPQGNITHTQVFASASPVYYRGKASWYGMADDECVGCSDSRIMSNGVVFDEMAHTAACDYRWELGDLLRVSYGSNSVDVHCTDRGGFKKYDRILDLSKGAFLELTNLSKGIIEVRVEKI